MIEITALIAIITASIVALSKEARQWYKLKHKKKGKK